MSVTAAWTRRKNSIPPLLHILRKPRQVPRVPILHVRRLREAVELSGIDHQLRRDAEGAERLVHLLAVERGDVEIALAGEEERRRLDAIGVEERERDARPRLRMFPRPP